MNLSLSTKHAFCQCSAGQVRARGGDDSLIAPGNVCVFEGGDVVDGAAAI